LTISVVLADASILFSRTLRDYFLCVADAGAIEIHWSQQILDEMSRNLRTELGLDHNATTRLEGLMNSFTPKSEADILATLERSTGPAVLDAIRRVIAV